MRKLATFLMAAGAVALLAGCGGAERKLGRGINNSLEFTRMGELRRSIEQAGLWEGPDAAFTTGLVRGVSRTFARTAIGLSEVLTFPIPTPNYDPYFFPASWFQDPFRRVAAEPFTEQPPYPDNYKPGLTHDNIFATDTAVGFAGGEIIPFIPGSRFRVFDR